MNKIVKEINKLEESIKQMTDEQLKEKTVEFKQKLKNGNNLDNILVEAFAVAKEATKRVTGKILYDVQLMAGYILHQGGIAEIKAGEGKTLTETLPAYLNALEGKGVHIVTTNEYLAKRDFNEVGKILEFLGLTVGLIYQGMDVEERKQAYEKDITYGVNTEFGFDYLRDNNAITESAIVQRNLNYAIIDEADSILIDEAQTPMIISKKNFNNSIEAYKKANEFVEKLEGTEIIKEDVKDKKQLRENEEFDYTVDLTYNVAELTQKGISKVEKYYGLDNYYKKENVGLINYINQALRANTILKRDVDYIVKNRKIYIIDKFTGRIMYGKKFTNGLHEAVEVKEGLAAGDVSEPIATISTQNYFKMYKKLSGMTGTAKESEKEFNEVYKLNVTKVPTHKKTQRVDKGNKIYINEEEKYKAIIEEVKKSQISKQPVLIGTTSIEESEKLSNALTKQHINHQLLNANFYEKEAQIVAEAGKLGKVTIATNMAGRGADILLGGEEQYEKNKVKAVGGLKVIGTAKHESKRIDEQLKGRCGRHGEIGETVFYLSLEDEILKVYGNKKIIQKYKNKAKTNKELKNPSVKKMVKNAQKEVENKNYTIRKQLVYYDEVLNMQREIIYRDRKRILKGDINQVMYNFISYFCNHIILDANIKAQQMLNRIEKMEKIKIDNDFEKLNSIIKTKYEQKRIEVGKEKFEKIEKEKLLKIIDQNWIEHMEIIEELKNNMELRRYGGHEPVEEYEKEGKELFDDLMDKIKMNMVNQLLFGTNYYM